MQIYLEDCFLYDFNWQRVYEARYIFKNPPVNQKYRKYDENNIKYGGNIMTKASKKPNRLLAFTNQKLKHIYILLFCD